MIEHMYHYLWYTQYLFFLVMLFSTVIKMHIIGIFWYYEKKNSYCYFIHTLAYTPLLQGIILAWFQGKGLVDVLKVVKTGFWNIQKRYQLLSFILLLCLASYLHCQMGRFLVPTIYFQCLDSIYLECPSTPSYQVARQICI